MLIKAVLLFVIQNPFKSFIKRIFEKVQLHCVFFEVHLLREKKLCKLKNAHLFMLLFYS